jgi:hypothetical protein
VALQLHLESHAARLRERALQVKEWHKRVAFVEDIDLFSNLARQFVEGTQPSTGQASRSQDWQMQPQHSYAWAAPMTADAIGD